MIPPTLMWRCREFIAVYRLYRRGTHTRRYAATIAYGCAFKRLPF